MRSNPSDHIKLFATLMLTGLCVVGCGQPPTVVCEAPADECICNYNGHYYAAGSSFPADDGCNTCSCTDNGSVVCTKIACPAPHVCGGLQGAQCPDGQYCDFPVEAMCGAADATGTCKKPSEICPDIEQPVCGCDDKTYPNACYASRAGTSVASTGECKPATGCDFNGMHYDVGDSFKNDCNTCVCQADGKVICTLIACLKTCGGFAGTQCDDTEYCNFAPDAMCGAADATGTCASRPEICNDLVDPVCGCDGMAYVNACHAHRAGTSVQMRGDCP